MRVERNKSGRGRGQGRSSTRNFGGKKKSNMTLSNERSNISLLLNNLVLKLMSLNPLGNIALIF